MFKLRLFIKKGFTEAVGQMADYKIILNAASWHEKGVLTEDDLNDINTALESQYVIDDPTAEEMSVG